MILNYKILNFAHDYWRVKGVYLIIDSFEIIRFTFTIFKRAINYFQNYLMHHVLTEKNFESRVKKCLTFTIVNLDRAIYTERLIIVSVSK